MEQPISAPPASRSLPEPRGNDADIPLAVDLDGTLVFTDTLFEALAHHLRQRPLWTIWQMMLLPFAIARVKARIQGRARIDIATLPVNEAVLSYCRRANADGRKVWLVSAADQGIVSEVAGRFGVFDRAVGSDGTTNNKGANKGRFLVREAPQGFEYIGDSRADMKVWAMAKAASIVGGGEPRRRAVERLGVHVAQTFERPSRGVGPWLKALRVHLWAKNLLIFVPAIPAMHIVDPRTLATLLAALPVMCAMASGVYILNDLFNLTADRNHPIRKNRPFASGRLKLWQAFVAAPLLIVSALVAGLMLSPGFAAALLVYAVMALAHAYALKRIPFLDVVTLGLLDTMLVVTGAVLTNIALSPWVILGSTLLFVLLAVAVRLIAWGRRV